MHRIAVGLALSVAVTAHAPAAEPMRRTLEYAPAPVDNPLKGLVPYAGDVRDFFPHSLEFNYVSFASLVVGPDRYDWKPLEKLLNDIAGRGHQAVFRVYLEYPDKKNCIPEFLVKGGLKVHKYLNTNTQPLPPAQVETPDYADPNLRKAIAAYIRELGRKYDGDPRIGYIHAGLLGTWGEWHTYPKDELFASKAVQKEVLDAYEAAFRKTPVLLRYPAGESDDTYAPTARRPFGYHDDSFAWATLETGKPDDEWFYMTRLRAAGGDALDKWKTQPIGGEIRPEAWGKVFDPNPGDPQIQDFRKCVEATHATWLMDSGLFEKKPSADLKKRAEAQVRRLGYEFHIPAATLDQKADGKLTVVVEIENRGIAPFYQDWRPELALLDGQGQLSKPYPVGGKLTGLLPGDPKRTWAETIDTSGLKPGTYRVLLRVANPLPNGKPLRFANADQDRDQPGWLTLGEAAIR